MGVETLTRETQEYIIRLSENALIQMCLNGLEAYSIQHKGRAGHKERLETYGLLWGHEVNLPNKQTLYCVEMATIDTSAKMDKLQCESSLDAFELKRDLMTSFWPQYDFLGDFHTHPFTDAQAVMKRKDYGFSDTDYASIEDEDYWFRFRYRVGLVLTITTLKRKSAKENNWFDPKTIMFTLGNYRLLIRGYVAYPEENRLKLTRDEDDNVTIDCPALIGLKGEYTEFGRAIDRRGSKHLSGQI